MIRALAVTGLGILILAVAGCGSSGRSAHSILISGYTEGPSPSDKSATQAANYTKGRWRLALAIYRASGSGGSTTTPGGALSSHQFRRRLAVAAARYRFTVKRVEFAHARVLAPLVIVQTRHYLALSRAIHAFYPSLCARRWRRHDCAAPVAPFFEAQDEHGVPFIALGNGQWARSERLYPYAHG